MSLSSALQVLSKMGLELGTHPKSVNCVRDYKERRNYSVTFVMQIIIAGAIRFHTHVCIPMMIT